MTEKAPLKMVKPTSFLEKFKSKRPPNIAGVGTLLTPLKLMRIAEVGDFVRLHPNEDNYWTCELCFVSVPIKGVKRPMLHLIDEEIAMQHLEEDQAAAMGPGVETPRRLSFSASCPRTMSDARRPTKKLDRDGCGRAKTASGPSSPNARRRLAAASAGL